MNEVFDFIAKNDQYFVAGIILIFSLFEILGGILKSTKRNKGDFIQEFLSFSMLSVFIKPGIVLFVDFLGKFLLKDANAYFTQTNFFILLLVYLLVDDLMQYWYHRSAHEYAFLWKLHRPHHTAKEMGLLVSYRNAMLYYVLMPNIWWIGIVTFLGGGKAVALGLILKQLVIISSHSTTKWDQYLYRYPFLNPVSWVLERIFVTPAFHFAHHGKSKDDEISDPNNNFGNMFSFWDILFKTAVFTRKYPQTFGLQSNIEDEWQSHVFYPILQSSNEFSEISKSYKKECKITFEPSTIPVSAGNYLWCSCGFSKNQPFCDGSHHGTQKKPLLIKVESEQTLYLCNCKLSKKSPYCDGSHRNRG